MPISNDRLFSIEFFPPNTPEGMDKLRTVRTHLAQLSPAYFSVTHGAGGSTRERTLSTVLEIQQAKLSAAPHISCVGSSRESIRELLAAYRSAGIGRLVALRGDLPSGMGDPGEFRYANELVEFIRTETGDHFHVEVACYPEYHPQAKSPAADMQAFVRKVEAGADAAITQFFYNPDAYFAFLDAARAAGVKVPIVPGIMPFHNFSKIVRFADSCGAEVPRWVRLRMEKFYDDAPSVRAFGIDVVTALCERLLAGGAPGLHFYTLNQSGLTTEIWQRLKLG
ncbi:MAG: methylenetetrahydrofolate reductase [NAD(P)H] [Betaproteobacteria bacterium]